MGFRIDSAFNVIGPLIGSSPVIYYAENHAARLIGARSGWPAIIAGACFGLLGVGAYFWVGGGHALPEFPSVCVAATLFMLGLIVIAESLGLSSPEKADNSAGFIESAIQYFNDRILQYTTYFPAALAVVLTPIIGFDGSLAIGIAAYYALAFIDPHAQRDRVLSNSTPLHFLAGLAVFSVLVKAIVYFW